MKLLQAELLRDAVLVCTTLMTACTSPGYNNNPSQQITNVRVGCPAATDFFAVYFSVRVQPPVENQDARIKKDVFRSYCQDIPTPGKIFFTADLVGNELRQIPIGIRIVEREFADDESRSGNLKDLRTIAEIPAKTYSNGVIETYFELDRKGSYAIYLTRGGEGAVSEQDKLTIPLNVGVRTGARPLITGVVEIFAVATVLALIGFVVFRYVRRRMAL